MDGKIISINISGSKGKKKKPVAEAEIVSLGLKGDAHGGNWHRQVSLLPFEAIKQVNEKGVDAKPGDFAENITVSGIDFDKIKVGDAIVVGTAKLEVTQIGKECTNPCNIYYIMGYCIMPEKGVFCRVLNTGNIKTGDEVRVFYGN